MNLPANIQGLVFDVDGTIADTMPLHYKAWVAALGEYGHDFPEAMFYDFAGVPTLRILEILVEKHGYRLDPATAAQRKDDLFLEFLPLVKPLEPVVKYVHEFRGRLPMAVATGGTRSMCVRTLDAMGMKDCFQAMVTADDVVHGKPAPDIFLEAARRLGVPPQLCAAFEDAEMGLRSARAAGMYVIDVRPLTGGK